MSVGGVGGPGRLSSVGNDSGIFVRPASNGAAGTITRGTAPAGRMAVAAGGTPQSLDELAARIASLPRQASEYAAADFHSVSQRLQGSVTIEETEKILDRLDELDGPAWLALIDKLATTPSDESDKTLLEKFVRYGVSDRNRFIAAFADQANRKLGLGLPSLEEKADALEAKGMKPGRAERVAGREVRKENKLVLDYFESRDKQGFWNGVRATGTGIGQGVGALLMLPIIFLLSRNEIG